MRLFPHMTVEDNVGYGLRRMALDAARQAQAHPRSARHGAAGRARQAQAASAVRRPAAAGGAGARADPAAQGAAARRALERARQETARADAIRAHEHPVPGGHHLRVRHPRSGRGDGAVDAHRRHEPRPGGAGRHAVGNLRISAEPLRGRLHRHHQSVRGHGERQRARPPHRAQRRGGLRSDRR